MGEMKVRVLLFGHLRERLGGRVREVRLPVGATVGEAIGALEIAGDGVRFAIGDELVEPDRTLRDGEELAVLPPVSGG